MPDADSGRLAPVVRLHSTRTLVVSRDLAFRQRAVAVLGQLGVVAFAVVSLEAAEQIVELVQRERAHVVVLDVTGSTNAIASTLIALCAEAPLVGVVLVATQPDRSLRLPTLDKWGWAEDLSRAVQQAYHRGNPLKEDSANAGHTR